MAASNLTLMDEAQLVELPSGHLLANMRHTTAPSLGRGVSRSTDSGASWGPVSFDATLTSPVCMGTIIRLGNQVFFANPASTTGRQHGLIRRSPDGVAWSKSTQLVFDGAFGYSCLTHVPSRSNAGSPHQRLLQGAQKAEADHDRPGSVAEIGVLWESDGPQCAPGGASCRTLFSIFPTDF